MISSVFRDFRGFRGSLVLFLIGTACIGRVALACPFCPQTAPTLSEELSRTDVVALGRWTGAVQATGDAPGRTTFEVIATVKAPTDGLEKGQTVTLSRHLAGRPGDLFLLTGVLSESAVGIDWDSPREITETGYQYVAKAPSPEAPAAKRLEYYLKFLEYADPFIANDAYAEFARAPYRDVAALKLTLDRRQIRHWLADPGLLEPRRGLYGLMLGLCGNADDAKLLEQIAMAPGDEFRLGIDGVIAGYLLLAGDKGLDVIDRTRLADPDAPAGELFAAMSALRFFWTYGDGTISRDRLRKSMRVLLDRQDVVDLVIADLARWQDWSVQDKLVELYLADDFKDPSYHRSVKTAVIRYLLVCAKDTAGDSAGEPEHVKTAEEHLATLREKDPALVRQAERFFIVD